MSTAPRALPPDWPDVDAEGWTQSYFESPEEGRYPVYMRYGAEEYPVEVSRHWPPVMVQ